MFWQSADSESNSMPRIDGLNFRIEPTARSRPSLAAVPRTAIESCLTLTVSFRVCFDSGEHRDGPLLGRIEIHATEGTGHRRLFDLVPGFLVDAADGDYQTLTFSGEMLPSELEATSSLDADTTARSVAMFRLSGSSMPDSSPPVFLPTGALVSDLCAGRSEQIEAEVRLRAIGSGHRVAVRSDAHRAA
jgi:hypothetical protein